jgi:hypothetical protein
MSKILPAVLLKDIPEELNETLAQDIASLPFEVYTRIERDIMTYAPLKEAVTTIMTACEVEPAAGLKGAELDTFNWMRAAQIAKIIVNFAAAEDSK